MMEPRGRSGGLPIREPRARREYRQWWGELQHPHGYRRAARRRAVGIEKLRGRRSSILGRQAAGWVPAPRKRPRFLPSGTAWRFPQWVMDCAKNAWAPGLLSNAATVLPLSSVLFLSASRNGTRIMARRQSLSTALPAPFASLPCWPFPSGDRSRSGPRLFMPALRDNAEGTRRCRAQKNEPEQARRRILGGNLRQALPDSR